MWTRGVAMSALVGEWLGTPCFGGPYIASGEQASDDNLMVYDDVDLLPDCGELDFLDVDVIAELLPADTNAGTYDINSNISNGNNHPTPSTASSPFLGGGALVSSASVDSSTDSIIDVLNAINRSIHSPVRLREQLPPQQNECLATQQTDHQTLDKREQTPERAQLAPKHRDHERTHKRERLGAQQGENLSIQQRTNVKNEQECHLRTHEKKHLETQQRVLLGAQQKDYFSPQQKELLEAPKRDYLGTQQKEQRLLEQREHLSPQQRQKEHLQFQKTKYPLSRHTEHVPNEHRENVSSQQTVSSKRGKQRLQTRATPSTSSSPPPPPPPNFSNSSSKVETDVGADAGCYAVPTFTAGDFETVQTTSASFSKEESTPNLHISATPTAHCSTNTTHTLPGSAYDHKTSRTTLMTPPVAPCENDRKHSSDKIDFGRGKGKGKAKELYGRSVMCTEDITSDPIRTVNLTTPRPLACLCDNEEGRGGGGRDGGGVNRVPPWRTMPCSSLHALASSSLIPPSPPSPFLSNLGKPGNQQYPCSLFTTNSGTFCAPSSIVTSPSRDSTSRETIAFSFPIYHSPQSFVVKPNYASAWRRPESIFAQTPPTLACMSEVANHTHTNSSSTATTSTTAGGQCLSTFTSAPSTHWLCSENLLSSRRATATAPRILTEYELDNVQMLKSQHTGHYRKGQRRNGVGEGIVEEGKVGGLKAREGLKNSKPKSNPGTNLVQTEVLCSVPFEQLQVKPQKQKCAERVKRQQQDETNAKKRKDTEQQGKKCRHVQGERQQEQAEKQRQEDTMRQQQELREHQNEEMGRSQRERRGKMLRAQLLYKQKLLKQKQQELNNVMQQLGHEEDKLQKQQQQEKQKCNQSTDQGSMMSAAHRQTNPTAHRVFHHPHYNYPNYFDLLPPKHGVTDDSGSVQEPAISRETNVTDHSPLVHYPYSCTLFGLSPPHEDGGNSTEEPASSDPGQPTGGEMTDTEDVFSLCCLSALSQSSESSIFQFNFQGEQEKKNGLHQFDGYRMGPAEVGSLDFFMEESSCSNTFQSDPDDSNLDSLLQIFKSASQQEPQQSLSDACTVSDTGDGFDLMCDQSSLQLTIEDNLSCSRVTSVSGGCELSQGPSSTFNSHSPQSTSASSVAATAGSAAATVYCDLQSHGVINDKEVSETIPSSQTGEQRKASPSTSALQRRQIIPNYQTMTPWTNECLTMSESFPLPTPEIPCLQLPMEAQSLKAPRLNDQYSVTPASRFAVTRTGSTAVTETVYSLSPSMSLQGEARGLSPMKRQHSQISDNISNMTREKRFRKTADALQKCGLWDIAMKTGELIKRNVELQKQIERFRGEATVFLKAVVQNPENQELMNSLTTGAPLTLGNRSCTTDGYELNIAKTTTCLSKSNIFDSRSSTTSGYASYTEGETKQSSPTRSQK